MARPLYAEPRLPAGLFGGPDAEAIGEDCSNCTGPQVTGAEGVCRRPSVLAERGHWSARGTPSGRSPSQDGP